MTPPPPPHQNFTEAPIVSPSPSTSQRNSRLFSFGRALKSLVSGSQDEPSNSSQIYDAREATVQTQPEVTLLRQQLEESQKERKTLEKEIIDLTASQQRARQETEAVSLQLRQARDLIQRRNAEMEELKAEYRKLDTPSGAEHTNAMIADLALSNQELTEAAKACEGRIHALTLETANLKSQLKQARTSSGSHSAITNSTMSLDPFDNKLDQVSEASLKGGVEGINDSLDNLVLVLLDKAEELAKQSAHGSQPLAPQTHDGTSELLEALAAYGQDEDKRGFLLDVLLHQAVIKHLTTLFFSGEVVARVLDSKGIHDMYLMELAKREPWTVVQRWRALTATGASNLFVGSQNGWKKSRADLFLSIVTLLSRAHRQPLKTFEPLMAKLHTSLDSIYDEAYRLSITARRDILSARMSIITIPQSGKNSLTFNPDLMGSVWPDMGPAPNDAVIAPYKFGLKKETELGEVIYLIKPEVATTALLREMKKESS
ncbi:hypothetical protein C8J57DRAFT_1174932 [Mycena rebaudengoi]|nr:hypothetical protein C8J57DRAFT_1174932 [Mycena rebaudengoi]